MSIDYDYLDYIDRLTRGLKEVGITSVASLFSYDMLDMFYESDDPDFVGWLHDDIQFNIENTPFFDYLIERFGSVVDRWVTFEKIQQEIILGYGDNLYPPGMFGDEGSTDRIFKAMGNLFKAHVFLFEKFKAAGLEIGVGVEAFQYAKPADISSEIDLIAASRHNDFNIGIVLSPLMTGKYPDVVSSGIGNLATLPDNLAGSFDFISFEYETTGLVTKKDEKYNVSLPEFFYHENFEYLRGSDYSSDWTGQQGGKPTQRFVQNGLKDFISEFIKPLAVPVYIKTKWTTSNLFEIDPEFEEELKSIKEDYRLPIVNDEDNEYGEPAHIPIDYHVRLDLDGLKEEDKNENDFFEYSGQVFINVRNSVNRKHL